MNASGNLLLRRLMAWLALAACVAMAWPQPVTAQGAWPPVVTGWVVGGLDLPMGIVNAGDGSGRLFVIEQRGRVRIVRNGVLDPTPFLDVRAKVSCCSERGLLGLAFPPGYAAKGHFYVNFTDSSGNTVVARYRVSADPDVADPGSEQVVLSVNQPYANHNGGNLVFGPDGFLYVGLGDGGSAGDPQNRAQNPQELLGKMLRIDVETGNPATYTVPATNPFVGNAAYRPEIWALGLRNPWRYSFDRTSGDLYIGDVGQNSWEEIDYQPAGQGGQNYGWVIMEGQHCYNAATCSTSGLTLPVAEYSHAQGCSVTGGHIYRGNLFPALDGIYFYGDYCSGRLWGMRRTPSGWESTVLRETGLSITAFGEDEQGQLYVTDYTGGAIYLVRPETLGRPIYLPVILSF